MKNHLSVCVALMMLLCMMSTSANAQLQLGVKAGINVATFRTTENNFFFFDEGSAIAGPTVGAFALIEGKDSPFALRLELLYSEKGGNTRSSFDNITLFSKINLHYLSLPVLFNLKKGPIHLEIGPEISYLLAARAKIQGGDQQNIADDLDSRSDISLALGMYYKFKKIQAGFRYLHGFSRIISIQGVDFNGFPIDSGFIKNKSVQFWIGFQFFEK